ncbi:MAG: hypothetical protein ACREP7_23680 [Lysobacter sp.]
MYATPTTVSGESLRLYTDTGGGNLLCRKAADRLRLALETLPPNPELEAELGNRIHRAQLPAFKPNAGVPGHADGGGSLLVHECEDHNNVPASTMGDGLLSSRTLDYPGGAAYFSCAQGCTVATPPAP